MPCEVNLPTEDFSYHNLFICPVTKEVNLQPVLLKCGHVIGKASVLKLNRGNSANNFKCPTCPTEMTMDTGVEFILY